MDIEIVATIILGSLCLCGATVNFIHWRRLGVGRLFNFPACGWARTANWAWMAAQVIAAILWLAGLLSPAVFLITCFSWNVAANVHSVWYRQTRMTNLTRSRAG